MKLRNKYTKEIVYCKNIDKVVVLNNQTFISVFEEKKPDRIFLANKNSFEIIK